MIQRKGNWLETAGGRRYYPCDPRPHDVFIEDIAHALSHLCRYTGHCARFYSVAEHSVLVSRMVAPHLAFVGLMHDATEAYVADVNRPLKSAPEMAPYRAIERLNWVAIADRFGLPEEIPAEVNEADRAICAIEKQTLMPNSKHDWGIPMPAGHAPKPRGMSPATAKAWFLSEFHNLCPWGFAI